MLIKKYTLIILECYFLGQSLIKLKGNITSGFKDSAEMY